jgi:transcriptional regulator with XRE-family HTH domain
MTEAKKKNGKARGRSKPGPRDLLGRFGPYLEQRRKQENLTLRGLARLARCAHTNLYQFEQEGKNPRLTELAALAEAFREPLDKFLKPVL